MCVGLGRKISSRGKVTLIDVQGNKLTFGSLVECAQVLGEDRNRIARYVNKDKFLICNNNQYYVKR